MTLYEFMMNALYLLGGVAALAVAVVIVYVLIAGIARTIEVERERGKERAKWQK